VREAKLLQETHVADGTLQIIFWHNLDSVPAATRLHIGAHCAGEQDVALFWAMYDEIFANQRAYFSADDALVVDTAVSLGADRPTLEACYFGGDGRTAVEALDVIRRERGISGRPVFDINGQLVYGSQPIEVFNRAIQSVNNE
jgi:predicted DsbA family dithiol-disulfide isomerase